MQEGADMEYLKTSFLVVFPLFLKLALGYVLKQTKLMSERSFKEMNNVIFRSFFPALLFMNIYQANLEEAVSARLIAFACSSLVVLFIIAMIIVPRFEKENRKRGVLVQGISRSNFILFGIPVATALYGEKSLGVASILVGVVVPLINTLSVIALEYFRGSKPSLKKVLKGIIGNPIIIGAVSALVLVIFGVKLPSIIEKFLGEMANIATPLALVILGGSVTFSSIRNNRVQLTAAVIARLVLVPMAGLSVAVALGFREIELVILMAMFASPSAVSSYTMAMQMDGDGELAGQLVVFTTVFSIITMFLWIALLMAFGFF